MYDEVGTCGIRVLISSYFCFQEVKSFTTVGEMEWFSLEHGEQIVAVLVSSYKSKLSNTLKSKDLAILAFKKNCRHTH